ncbi:MAG: hypothetical protein EPN91_05630 [Salinibacterium sp.]|nr:MAG: hypothetical protein EPN91_05630 [Salinibacterium sp.]
MTVEPMTPHEEEADAIKRIAQGRDGLLLHRYLRRILEAVVDLDSESALRSHNGRRSLARDLMRLMAEGIDEHRPDSSADDPILARTRGPVAVSGTGRSRRDARFLPRVDSYAGELNADGTLPAEPT